MNRKKICSVVILLVVLCVGMVACKNQEKEVVQRKEPEPLVIENNQELEKEQPTEKEENIIKIGEIIVTDENGDTIYNYAGEMNITVDDSEKYRIEVNLPFYPCECIKDEIGEE